MSLDRPEDQDIVIVGATGDLARRKLLPALWNLHLGGLLPENGQIIGYARSPSNDSEFRKMAADAVREFSRQPMKPRAWGQFVKRLQYCSGDEGYAGVRARCTRPERLVYLSIPPSVFGSTIKALDRADLVSGTRLVVEKPFGRDLASSKELGTTIHQHFEEKQVFRIDHYLGKETVQNILVFRFGNAIFERIWNRDNIDHVEFTVAESIGIEGRGAFYEETGALRDILQNHVFQVLSLLTMDAPSSFRPEAVRDEKAKLFDAMRPLRGEDVVRGQYTANTIGRKQLIGYTEEEGVAPDSQTETYAALRVHIDNWRWAGVPFYLRTGKRLPVRKTEVVVTFRAAPVPFFRSAGVESIEPNRLVLSIQPEESITFRFLAKVPGPELQVQAVDMDFSYGDSFAVQPAEAYERLLHDAMDGDHTLFARSDSVERSWEVVEPVICCDLPPVQHYAAGTWGPAGADELIAPRRWHLR